MPFAKVPPERKEEECISAGDSLKVEQEYYCPLSFPGGCRKRSLCCMFVVCNEMCCFCSGFGYVFCAQAMQFYSLLRPLCVSEYFTFCI